VEFEGEATVAVHDVADGVREAAVERVCDALDGRQLSQIAGHLEAARPFVQPRHANVVRGLREADHR
jgi:hypothetical protein